MINKLKNHPKFHSILVKAISSTVFILLFVFICAVFEWMYRGSITNQINNLLHNILWYGLK
jgi:hypothetical protein